MHEKIIKVLLMIDLCALKVYALLERAEIKLQMWAECGIQKEKEKRNNGIMDDRDEKKLDKLNQNQ